MSEELKACPFCGEEPWGPEDMKFKQADAAVWQIRCMCGIMLKDGGKAKAIAAWNHRAQPPATSIQHLRPEDCAVTCPNCYNWKTYADHLASLRQPSDEGLRRAAFNAAASMDCDCTPGHGGPHPTQKIVCDKRDLEAALATPAQPAVTVDLGLVIEKLKAAGGELNFYMPMPESVDKRINSALGSVREAVALLEAATNGGRG